MSYVWQAACGVDGSGAFRMWDWQLGVAPGSSGANLRSAFSKAAVRNSNTSGSNVQSTVFPGGAVASAWVSFQMFNAGALAVNQRYAGVGKSGTNNCLILGSNSGTANKLSLGTWDGTTYTILASESGASLVVGTPQRVDIQITSFGASATVNVYLNFILVITFTGDVRVGTLTSGFDSIHLPFTLSTGTNSAYISEVFCCTEDSRQYPALQDLTTTGAGTTNNWANNTHSSISDVNPTSSNTNAQLQQYNVTDAGSSAYGVQRVKWTLRAAKSTSPAVTQIAIGVNDGGSVAYGTGSTKAIAGTGSFAQYEQEDETNPNGGGAWTLAVLNSLQVNLEALT